MNCQHCNQEITSTTEVCPHCQNQIQPIAEIVEPLKDNPYAAPLSDPKATLPSTLQQEGDSTGGLIPYKNPKALLAYYLGIVSGLPLLGFPIAVAAFILGILGLRDRNRNPVIKGSVHAWIGIGCGGLFALLWGFMILALIIGLMADI